MRQVPRKGSKQDVSSRSFVLPFAPTFCLLLFFLSSVPLPMLVFTANRVIPSLHILAVGGTPLYYVTHETCTSQSQGKKGLRFKAHIHR